MKKNLNTNTTKEEICKLKELCEDVVENDLSKAENTLRQLSKLHGALAIARKGLDPQREDIQLNVQLKELDVTLVNAISSDYVTGNLSKSLRDVKNMLDWVMQYQATRMALCSVIDRAITAISAQIDIISEQVERDKLVAKISDELKGWSIDQLKAFDALVQTLHKG